MDDGSARHTVSRHGLQRCQQGLAAAGVEAGGGLVWGGERAEEGEQPVGSSYSYSFPLAQHHCDCRRALSLLPHHRHYPPPTQEQQQGVSHQFKAHVDTLLLAACGRGKPAAHAQQAGRGAHVSASWLQASAHACSSRSRRTLAGRTVSPLQPRPSRQPMLPPSPCTTAPEMPRLSSSPTSSSLTSSSCSTDRARSTCHSRCSRVHRAGKR